VIQRSREKEQNQLKTYRNYVKFILKIIEHIRNKHKGAELVKNLSKLRKIYTSEF
jgi:hypothetical protein